VIALAAGTVVGAVAVIAAKPVCLAQRRGRRTGTPDSPGPMVDICAPARRHMRIVIARRQFRRSPESALTKNPYQEELVRPARLSSSARRWACTPVARRSFPKAVVKGGVPGHTVRRGDVDADSALMIMTLGIAVDPHRSSWTAAPGDASLHALAMRRGAGQPRRLPCIAPLRALLGAPAVRDRRPAGLGVPT
jgi:hypothetical protein